MCIKISGIFFLSAVLFFSCHKKQINQSNTISAAVTNEKTDKKPTSIQPVIKNARVSAEADMANTGAMYNVDSMRVNNDTLSVFVNYSGGCKEHSFDLYSNGMFAKSLPPQLSLCLKHTSNEDACRKLIIQELKFNVNNLKYPGKNTVVLKLGNKKVLYATQ